ncbi:RNA polymerase sigma factor [Acuticoccus mangrovi]|uniref:RNA polymerase sigma factor n=1 Tax=Acuticoccus mangrovi TaxID=2796142 RepID=A0A934MFC4_9HYPH|nr:RNA polymerase sigma factor [Acuticoccus mangrovi]MBJ3774775.1 RNA polymerase sigma factor [Acuticoccus mangrovi]
MLIAFLPTMRRFALSLARQHDVADDLVQSACERALLNAGSFQPGTRFDAWMFRIIRNLWIDRIRRTNTQAAAPVEEADAVVGTDGVAVATSRLELSDTAQAIHQLPDEQREVLTLVCVEGLSYAEAAGVMGVPVGTVMSRLARARTKLAALLAEKGISVGAARSSPTRGSRS